MIVVKWAQSAVECVLIAYPAYFWVLVTGHSRSRGCGTLGSTGAN